MASINIRSDLYNRLLQKATDQHTSVEALVEQVLDEHAERESGDSGSDQLRRRAAFEAWVKGMREWAEKNLPPGHVVDDSRESIYEGRE